MRALKKTNVDNVSKGSQGMQAQIQTMVVTPEIAGSLLDHNNINRPLRQFHVSRIAAQIADGKWMFNGDTIKISDDGDVLDGQHRLWAILEAKQPVETIIVRGIQREAFSTIDAIRQARSGGDTIARMGAPRYRNNIAGALSWMLRWQRGVLETYRDPRNRIENSDIEKAFVKHPTIERAVERVMPLRGTVNVGIISFVYYVLANKNQELSERLLSTLENPVASPIDDPFYRLRAYFTADYTGKKKSPLIDIALTIKACNAAHKGLSIKGLNWRSQGDNPEKFPKFDF